MRLFSKISEYAIRALIVLADEGVWRMRVETICERDDLPLHFTRKAMQTLVRHQYVEALRGPNGGYMLKVRPDKIRLADIVKIFDHSGKTPLCPLGENHCDAQKPCLLRSFSIRSSAKTRDTLMRITVAAMRPKTGRAIEALGPKKKRPWQKKPGKES